MVIAEAKKLFIVIIGALLNAIGLNLFLIPADVYASGFTGVAQTFYRARLTSTARFIFQRGRYCLF